jgi:hypothetical protein
MGEPEYITRERLEDRLHEEVEGLTGDDRAWWSEHRIAPLTVTGSGQTVFAVAVSGTRALIFFDDEDEFGSADLGPGATFVSGKLYGDLVDAVRGLRYLEQAGTSGLSTR